MKKAAVEEAVRLMSYTVDFNGYMHSCRARLFWQTLFDMYRSNGGQLDRLDNLLVDYEYCKQVIDEDKSVKILWGFSLETGFSEWIREPTWFVGNMYATVDCMSSDVVFLIDFTPAKATVTKVKDADGLYDPATFKKLREEG